jgi:hypothetical protein
MSKKIQEVVNIGREVSVIVFGTKFMRKEVQNN